MMVFILLFIPSTLPEDALKEAWAIELSHESVWVHTSLSFWQAPKLGKGGRAFLLPVKTTFIYEGL